MSFPTSWRKCPQVASALHSAGARHRARPTQPEFESPERERPETQREGRARSLVSTLRRVSRALYFYKKRKITGGGEAAAKRATDG